MKTAAFSLAALLNAAYSIAFAQGASESMAHLRTCSQMDRAERLECQETMSRKLAQVARAAADSDNWLVSETTSPVDYSPVVAAATLSRGSCCMPGRWRFRIRRAGRSGWRPISRRTWRG